MPDRTADRTDGEPIGDAEPRGGRVSRWDRPAPPRDWRYFVGGLGRALIVIGVLMFGFVAYQLWGTGIETARAQNRLERAFEVAIAEREPASPAASTTTTPATSTTTPATSTTTTPATTTTTTSVEQPTDEPPTTSDLVPGGVDLSDGAVDRDLPPIERGDVIARLEIPTIDQDLYVVAGVTLDDLKAGPGWYPDSSPPGQLGNTAIAGHRTTYGAPFFDVDRLAPGDELILTSITGDRFVYAVTGTEIVSATDYWVVTTRDPDVAELTLTSCHPKYTADERIVVHSVLVPERSDPVGTTDDVDLDGAEPGQVPGDEPPVVTRAPTTDVPVETEPTTTEAPTTTTAPPVDDAPPDAGPGDEPEQIDAFSQGWFDDTGAWPQIALWSLALALVSALAYQAAKRTRHTSVGVLVGIGPFLVALYFFYQNVNRLLPPGL